MSIIITGLEMPTERGSLNLTIKYNGVVFDTETGMQVAEAHELPPYGRLIDADALIEKVIAKYLEHERKGELVFAAAEIKQDICDLISDAPTIIEAEEGE